MKFKKSTLLPLLLMMFVSLLASCSSDDDYLPPNKEVVNELYQLYPDARNVEWSQKGVYYVADCYAQGVELDVWIDANANWVQTEKSLLRENLPASVYTAFEQGDYGSWAIDEITLLTFPINPTLFVIEVEQGNREVMLFYSEYGGLLHTKDVTNGDDTLWPGAEL